MTPNDDESPVNDYSSRIPWRRLPFSDAPLGRQFALSEGMLATLRDAPVPTYRWYAPRETALAVGNGQPLATIDLDACQANGIAVYRRSSGGTAVLVDRAAFSLDLALPAAHPLATTDVTLAYRWVGELMAQVMRALGVTDARAIPTDEVRALPPLARDDPLRLACYGTLSPWEVVIPAAAQTDGDSMPQPPRKLVGLCQVRRQGGALFQIGFYRHFDAQTLARLLAIAPDAQPALAARLADVTIGLRQASTRTRPHPTALIMRAFERALTLRASRERQPNEWTDAELAIADRLERDRFGRIG